MKKQEKDNIKIETPAQENNQEPEASGVNGVGEEIPNLEPTTPNYLQIDAEIKRLNQCLEEKIKEAETNYNKFLRTCADLENYKKRVEKEKGELISFSNERLIKELIPVVDNLERAVGHIEDESDLSAIQDGIKLILDNLLAVLKKFGIGVVSAMGAKFDPAKHEAVNQEETSECEPGTVVKEFHKCYYLNGRLLRPAMVVISKLPETLPEMEEAPGRQD
ncbi:MAG: nucleotide exchange factor GrpE [Deltaproteobacteria bacterium]|nr:nucleotide exchange factor GrpE [Deltaproteobacteria bacterium]